MIAALALATAITVTDAWSRPAIGTGVVYLRIANGGTKADRLDDARSPISKAVEIHESVRESKPMAGMVMTGVESMRRVRALTIPARGSVTFDPGHYHLMAIGLRHDLHANERFPVQLHFASAGWKTIMVRVRPI